MQTRQPNPNQKLGTFIPYALRFRKKFNVMTKPKNDKRCHSQDLINFDLLSRAQHAYRNKGVYPITQQEKIGLKLRAERNKLQAETQD